MSCCPGFAVPPDLTSPFLTGTVSTPLCCSNTDSAICPALMLCWCSQYLKSQLSAATSALRESQALLTSVQQQCREQQQQISNTQQQLVSARNELTQCKGQLKAMATLQQQLAQQREVAKQVQVCLCRYILPWLLEIPMNARDCC